MFIDEILVCPKCQSSLQKPQGGDCFVCTACNHIMCINNGVVECFDGSDGGFDHRWRKHPTPQPTTVEQFVQKTGWQPGDLAGKVVIDGGCGIGRYCKFLDEVCRAKQAIGIDVSSDGLAAARQNAPKAELIKASLLKIPMKDNSVDAAISIGVLHHTPDPKASFLELARIVKPDGRLAVWVYTDPAMGNAKTRVAVDFLHEITKACPPQALYKIIEKYATKIRDTYYPTWEPLQQVIRPSYNPSNEQCISDMFDWHTPQYRFWHTAAEVKGWFMQAGFAVTWTGDFPVSMSGVKQCR
jgi:ubiquinone/menaquinone biosynthesis C-methylase UbiE